MFGYAGKLLRINLSTGDIWSEALTESRARKFLGGRGIGAQILFDEVPTGADPLGPENRLIFAMGPLAGTAAPGSGRFAVVGKSPLTGVFGEAYTGGFFAHELKYAGFDGIVVQGKSDAPVYIHIRDQDVQIRSASHLWGKETVDTQDALRRELHDPGYRIAGIGVAGENQVRFACVINDADRAAGRTGLGAVMGSKNLKAIAVRGRGGVQVADPAFFMKHLHAARSKLEGNLGMEGLTAEGTSGGVVGLSKSGILPTRNWAFGTFENPESISGATIKEKIMVKNRACQACTVGCTRVVRVKEGPFAGVRPIYGGPEYETVAAFGSLCGNDNLESVAMANQLCNAHGMDTISCGAVIAFAIECYEKGFLTREDVGFELAWGDAEMIVKLVDMIARREGVGDLLASGTREAARQIGGDAAKLAVHVKGLEFGMHEARGKKGLGISYATSPRGASHMEGFHDTGHMSKNSMPEIGVIRAVDPYALDGKSAEIRAVENYMSFINSIPLCAFLSPLASVENVDEVTGMVAAATGWSELSLEEQMTIGERNYNLARAFTVRESGGKPDDTLPWKIAQPLPTGATKGQSIGPQPLVAALEEYYSARGWAPDGVPSRQKLIELGLAQVADALD
ncbi:MAG: aldehyde ferredoxin oxidoreductase family protein [Phycisphaeraceae bacterium]|jgi:aldehyde:ferredoxin oxidoreductase|nr:aldehyde ferredoxin oxidoreductase family protein [Phycisphaeraceae bacterium]